MEQIETKFHYLEQEVRIDRQFRAHPRQYAFQAGLATLTLALVLCLESALSNAALITAIAASAFVVFIGPNNRLAAPQRVLGGHFIGCVIGLLGAALLGPLHDYVSDTATITHIFAALGVGITIFGMGALDWEHPPAAGTVLGLILGVDVLENAALVMLSVAMINVVRALLRRRLVDLL